MDNFTKGLEVMRTLFEKDYQFALATVNNNMPSLRFVDTYLYEGCFYIVTYAGSQKIKDIIENPNVALSGRRMYSFTGKAFNIGHPLSQENNAIRSRLIEAFESWYFKHNDENDKNMCYMKIQPTEGFFYKDGTGYRMDFVNKTADIFPFTFDITVTED